MIDPEDEFLFDDTSDFFNEVDDSDRGIFLSQIFQEDDEAPAKRPRLSHPDPEPPASVEDKNKNQELSNRKKRILEFFSPAVTQATASQDTETSPESQTKKKHIPEIPKNNFPKTPQKELLKTPDDKISTALRNRQTVQAIIHQPARQTESPKSSRLESIHQQPAGQTKSSARYFRSIDSRAEPLLQHKTLKEIRSPNLKQILQTVDKSLINEKQSSISKQNLDFSFKTPRILKTPVSKSPPEELQQVVRRFPGPAGLLPDTATLSDSTSIVNYLHILDANERNRAKSLNESRAKDICTQETKKLFTDGSWRTMINDLPPNFLENQDIKSIKMSGADKIPLLAAVIHKFNYTTDPMVLLKDMSDTIEGIMHRKVPIEFPNIFQPGVVIILGGVNCLSFRQTKTWRTRKVIAIRPSNVLGIYGEKSRLDSTPTLDAIISGKLSQTDTLEIFSVDKSKENKPVEPKSVNKKTKEIAKESNNKNDTVDFCNLDFDMDDFDDPFNDSEVSLATEKINSPEKLGIQNSVSTCSSLSSESTQKTFVESQPLKASQVPDKKENTPPPGTPEKSEKSGDSYTGFGADLLMESDSEDELMSQVDIDAIAANAYNSQI